jgi:hypothetical protein
MRSAWNSICYKLIVPRKPALARTAHEALILRLERQYWPEGLIVLLLLVAAEGTEPAGYAPLAVVHLEAIPLGRVTAGGDAGAMSQPIPVSSLVFLLSVCIPFQLCNVSIHHRPDRISEYDVGFPK